jgi:hypothetical protein
MSKMGRLLENTDLRYYRDKYLALVTIFSSIVAVLLLFSSWPPNHDDLKHGLSLLALGAVALLFSSQRLVTLGAGVAFVGSRILIGMFFYHFPAILGIAIVGVCMLIVFALLLVTKDYRLAHSIGRYTGLELGIDSLVFCAILWLMIKIEAL